MIKIMTIITIMTQVLLAQPTSKIIVMDRMDGLHPTLKNNNFEVLTKVVDSQPDYISQFESVQPSMNFGTSPNPTQKIESDDLLGMNVDSIDIDNIKELSDIKKEMNKVKTTYGTDEIQTNGKIGVTLPSYNRKIYSGARHTQYNY